jgi:hypothetical protein
MDWDFDAECINKMESSLSGEFNGNYSDRSKMVDYARSFHYI